MFRFIIEDYLETNEGSGDGAGHIQTGCCSSCLLKSLLAPVLRTLFVRARWLRAHRLYF